MEPSPRDLVRALSIPRAESDKNLRSTIIMTRNSSTTTEPLGLSSVLTGSLPLSLLTDHAPERYTVEAVFTRRPNPEELKELLGGGTREHMSKSGYPTVEITVSDRRMEVANTNLQELRDGLGMVLSDLLDEISEKVRERNDTAAMQYEAVAAAEQERIAAVTELAKSVRFVTTRRASEDAHLPSAVDNSQMQDWASEGGQKL